MLAQNDDTQGMKFLFGRKDLDVNLADETGLTPLHLATYCGKVNAVAMLLGHDRIDPNIEDKEKRTPFAFALLMHNFPMIIMFVADPEVTLDANRLMDSDLLHYFASNGDIDAVSGLIARGFDPDRKDTSGRTALTIAIGRGDVEMVRVLLATRQIDINRKYKLDETPLHLACLTEKGSKCLRLLLLFPGIDVNATDSHGNTVLHLAVCTQIRYAVDILLHDTRVKKNVCNVEGVCCLFF
jgi:ankyrin repeat protein